MSLLTRSRPRLLRRGAPATAPAAREGVSSDLADLLVAVVWSGIATGFVELLGLLFGFKILGRITYDTLRTNWHFAWMVPVSDLAVFAAAGLALAALRLVVPGRVLARLSLRLCLFLAILAMALSIPGLHRVAVVTVSAGLAVMISSTCRRHAPALRAFMRRTLPLGIVTLAGLGAWSFSALCAREREALGGLPPASPGSPNVLLLVLDTVRADALTPYGARADITPNLARLAERGVRFEHARSTAPWTLPAHASLFTGHWRHELSANVGRPLDDTHRTLAEFLSAHGYRTGGFVANLENCNAWYGLDRGFAHYEDFYENATVTGLEVLRSSRLGRLVLTSRPGQKIIRSLMTPPRYLYRKSAATINRDALAWLSSTPDRPFFLFLNYFDAHSPYVLPPDADARFRDAAPVPGRSRSVLEHARSSYENCLAYVDDQIGRLLDELERRGQMENTIVIVTSDHGEAFGEHGLAGHGLSLYRSELHIPLMISFPPHVPEGIALSTPVSLRDIPATVAHLVGAREPAPFPGVSLTEHWGDHGPHGPSGPAPIISQVDRAGYVPPDWRHAPANKGTMLSLVADGWVYIRNGDEREELYDLHEDPHEQNDLSMSEDTQDDLERLREVMEGLMEQADAGR
jgi:arylsulfatase A-like enzyme